MSLSKDSQTSLLPGLSRLSKAFPVLSLPGVDSLDKPEKHDKWPKMDGSSNCEAQIEIFPLLTANSVNSSACIRLQHFYGL